MDLHCKGQPVSVRLPFLLHQGPYRQHQEHESGGSSAQDVFRLLPQVRPFFQFREISFMESDIHSPIGLLYIGMVRLPM